MSGSQRSKWFCHQNCTLLELYKRSVSVFSGFQTFLSPSSIFKASNIWSRFIHAAIPSLVLPLLRTLAMTVGLPRMTQVKIATIRSADK
jgi:hypothetical protein